MKKNKIMVNDLLRNEIIREIRYLNTRGLILLLDTIHDIMSFSTTYKVGGLNENE